MRVRKWKAFMYYEVWRIDTWLDGLPFKSTSIGFIHKRDADKYPKETYELSCVSTSVLRQDDYGADCELLPYLSDKS